MFSNFVLNFEIIGYWTIIYTSLAVTSTLKNAGDSKWLNRCAPKCVKTHGSLVIKTFYSNPGLGLLKADGL